MKLTKAETEFIKDQGVGRIATIDPDGMPHNLRSVLYWIANVSTSSRIRMRRRSGILAQIRRWLSFSMCIGTPAVLRPLYFDPEEARIAILRRDTTRAPSATRLFDRLGEYQTLAIQIDHIEFDHPVFLFAKRS